MNATSRADAKPKAPDTRALADGAQRFGARIDLFESSLDPAWLSRFSTLLSPWVTDSPSSRAQRCRLALFQAVCGPVPRLTELQGWPAQWSLQSREMLLPRLCAFALASRPGVIRSCVRRTARQSLEQMLGPVYAALRESACGGAAVASAIAEQPPLEWAWVGYSDLVRRGLWPGRSLRRLVRLTLPPAFGHPPLPGTCKPEPHDPIQLMSVVDAWFDATRQTA